MAKPTYDQLINGDDALVKQIERAYITRHGHPPGITDQAHHIWRLLEEGWTIERLLADIRGEAAPPATEPHPTPTPEPSFPIPDFPIDLRSWPRRGATHASGLLDVRWNHRGFAKLLGDTFSGRSLTQLNVLSALWPDTAPWMVHPFRQTNDGRWNLYDWNPAFFDRLRDQVDFYNRFGVVPVLCFLELYSWSYRKSTPMDKRLNPVNHNVNGISWLSTDSASDDATLAKLPDAWLLELVGRVLDTLRGLVFVVKPANEFPEKRVHVDIATFVKSRAPDVRVLVNRNDDTPGQYRNMKVGEGTVDLIAHHGWKNLGFLDRDFPDHYKNAEGKLITPTLPRNFRQFFENKAWDGRQLNHDFKRVVACSDGSRASDDPVNTYNWPELIKVFKFCADKGCSIEHQSRSKMTPGAQLGMVETDFLQQMAAL